MVLLVCFHYLYTCPVLMLWREMRWWSPLEDVRLCEKCICVRREYKTEMFSSSVCSWFQVFGMWLKAARIKESMSPVLVESLSRNATLSEARPCVAERSATPPHRRLPLRPTPTCFASLCCGQSRTRDWPMASIQWACQNQTETVISPRI